MASGEETFVVSFIATGTSQGEYRMVLVEQGPWQGDIEGNLRRLQSRLYDCVDAALDGQLAEKFPTAKNVTVELDCYNLPEDDVRPFFDRFVAGIFRLGDYENALKNSQFVDTIEFKISFDAIH